MSDNDVLKLIGESKLTLEAVAMSVKKQIFATPIDKWNEIKACNESHCPNCDRTLRHMNEYCPKCGQHLDWESYLNEVRNND